jgi:hypothetical protein
MLLNAATTWLAEVSKELVRAARTLLQDRRRRVGWNTGVDLDRIENDARVLGVLTQQCLPSVDL